MEKSSIQFACPHCFVELKRDLSCPKCDFKGSFQEGKFHLHRNDKTWDLCLEQNAAVKRADASLAKGYTDLPEEDAKRVRPATPASSPPKKNYRHELQDTIIKDLQPIQGKSFVEIGGQTGWATQRFIEAGASFGVNVDISDRYLPNSTNQIFSVVGDGYYLPLAKEQFDFVFDCASLHHFLDMEACLQEVKRVLKNNGVYYSQNNPHRSKGTPESATSRDLYWKRWGLIEIQPSGEEYQQVFNNVFGNIEFIHIEPGNIMVGRKCPE